MTEAEAIQLVRAHFETLFPKTCATCGRTFATLREYVLATTPAGSALSWDAEEKNWQTLSPMGSQAMANCACGSTLALTTEGMDLPVRLSLLQWLQTETTRRGVGASDVLESMRQVIRREVIG